MTEMQPRDAAWAAQLLEAKRREYARYSPVFWRPAEGAAPLHERFLRSRIAAADTVALRTPSGFIVCECRQGDPPEGFVDDFTVAGP
jgi:hypothetical protein